jgi:hypothetical protein
MSRTHDVAWAAGFFDGEGFVTIQKRNSKAKSGKRYESYYLRIGINHVAVEPLNEMLRIFGGTIRKQSAHSVVGNRHQRHSWQMSCTQAKEALITMMPYFRNKQKAAELGIELQNTMGTTSKTSDEVQIYRALLKDKLQNLNKMD